MSAASQANPFLGSPAADPGGDRRSVGGRVPHPPEPDAVELPVAPVRKGDFSVIVRCRGEIKASRSVSIYAPIVPNLRIAWMVPSGDRSMPATR